MITMIAPVMLATALVTMSIAGPRLLRSAAPVLMRVPRTAVAVLIGAGMLWLMASAALSLMIAGMVTGPDILPDSIAGVCERCLAAASPFSSTVLVDTVIPVALLVFLPAAGLALLIGIALFRGLRRRRVTATTARSVDVRAQRAIVLSHPVLVTEDAHLVAYSLPMRSGGIVISRALVAALHADELAAVLAHEQEHVRGRHHLVLAFLDVVVRPLHWIPFMAAIGGAVPHYLEIAADDAARRRAGTTALATALLKLGSSQPTTTHRAAAGAILHAAGADRIGHLVAPPRIRTAIAPMSALGATAFVLAAMAMTVHGAYISVIAAGCTL